MNESDTANGSFTPRRDVETAIARARRLATFERQVAQERGKSEAWRLARAEKLEAVAERLTQLLRLGIGGS